MCFLCFRNAAGWLPVNIPGVHVHQWPLSGSARTISFLANALTWYSHTSFLPPHCYQLSPWLLSLIAVPAAGAKRRVKTPSSGSARYCSWSPTGAGSTRTSWKKRSTSGASWRYGTTRLCLLYFNSLPVWSSDVISHMSHTDKHNKPHSSSFVFWSCSLMGSFFKFCTTGHQAFCFETQRAEIVRVLDPFVCFFSFWTVFQLSPTGKPYWRFISSFWQCQLIKSRKNTGPFIVYHVRKYV